MNDQNVEVTAGEAEGGSDSGGSAADDDDIPLLLAHRCVLIGVERAFPTVWEAAADRGH